MKRFGAVSIQIGLEIRRMVFNRFTIIEAKGQVRMLSCRTALPTSIARSTGKL